MPDSKHDLLLRHFGAWAQAKGRPVDAELLGRLLDLRLTYADLAATYWPVGSVEHLLLELWPAKGDVTPPSEQGVTDTLDAYFRFLRSTGRMGARSAEPAALRKEARRSAKHMSAAAADTSAWSPTKSLMEYGRGLGVEVDDAPDVETLQARLEQVQESWNALPVHERRRRMPGPGDSQLSGADQAMLAHRVDDPITALLLTFAGELPSGELPPPGETAPIVRTSPFTHQMQALCRWMGERAEVTKTGVLRPAAAHEAYEALGLEAWTRQQLARSYRHYVSPAVADVGADAWVDRLASRPWRYAGDCEALDRLWRGAIASGLIELDGTWAYPRLEPERDDEAWVRIGMRAGVQLLEDLCTNPYAAFGLVYGLLRSYVRGCAVVPWQEILGFLADWDRSVDERAYEQSIGYDSAPLSRSRVDRSCGALADTGVFTESEAGLALTPFGDVFVTAWLKFRER